MSGKIGLYLRLSQEDDERENESESISNQRTFLSQYVERNQMIVTDVYIDDGYTGTNFDRPDFKRLITDIEQCKIDTVITKDLSRFGRDYIMVGHYLERYFPEHGIRFIAVNDNIDTAAAEGAIRMAPFLSVMNDMYAQDISRKVRSALHAKKVAGKYVGSSAPYGYRKSTVDSGKLLIDNDAAEVVREIFREFLGNGSVAGIAKKLTEQGVPTPSQYKNLTFTQKRFNGVWNAAIIKRILTSPTYAGNLTQNRAKKINHKVDKKKNLPANEWIVVNNTHEPIVSQDDFNRVQEMLKTRSYKRQTSQPHLLTGLAFCADCGSAMTYVKDGSRSYMVCQGYRIGGRLKLCTAHTMREDFVIKTISETLKNMAVNTINDNDINDLIQKNSGDDMIKRQLNTVKSKLEAVKKIALNLYKDKVSGVIKENEYTEMNESVREERQKFENMIQDYENQLDKGQDIDEMRKNLKRILDFDAIDRATIVSLIEKILIYANKDIGIQFRFRQFE